MNRIAKYQESIAKFIQTKSHLKNFDDAFKKWINDEINSTDYTLSIILLTTMNNQNKKNKISLHGYYIASSMEFLLVLYRMINDSKEYKNKLDAKYSIYISNIILILHMSLIQNIESIETQTNLQKDKILNMNRSANKYLNDKITKLINTTTHITNKKEYIKTDVNKFHFKDNNLKKYFERMRQLEQEELMLYLNGTIGTICELAFGLGWILGCGEVKTLPKIEKISALFGILIKLTMDFDNIEIDLKRNIKDDSDGSDIVTTNYILNFGFQNSFELFLNTKQKFIEMALTHDIFTHTLKDICEKLEEKVEQTIDETSPDLLSNTENNIKL